MLCIIFAREEKSPEKEDDSEWLCRRKIRVIEGNEKCRHLKK